MTVVTRRWLVAGTMLLGGCNTILQRPPTVQTVNWPLTVRRPQALPARPHGKILLVRDIQAAPGLDQQGLEWLLPSGSVHIDFYNQWSVPPASAIAGDLRLWLADAGLFAAVIAPNSGLTPDLALEGTLLTFVGDPRTLTGRAALLVTVFDSRRAPPRVLTQTTLQATAPMPQDTPAGVASALQAAVARLMAEVEAVLARVVH
jgi:cholesterol transport system auxiliary component